MLSAARPGRPYRLGMPNTGRLFLESARLVRSALGIDVAASRGLLHSVDADLELLCARSSDLPNLIERGVCDAAITGADYVREHGGNLAVRAELGLCEGAICLLAPVGGAGLSGLARPRIASQYPRIASRWAGERGLRATILPVSGAAELYPRIGLADAIVDVVSSGTTAADNGLEVVAEIMRTSGCLYAPSAIPASADPRGEAAAQALRAAAAGEPV